MILLPRANTHHSDAETESRSKAAASVVYVLLPLSWVTVLGRVWIRTRMIHSYGWDDTMMLCTLAVYTAYAGVLLWIEANGGGTHVRDLATLDYLLQFATADEALYVVVMILLKISLGIFFLRIVVQRSQRLMIYFVVGFVCLMGTSNFFFVIFRCGLPKYYLWRTLKNECVPLVPTRFMLYMNGAVSAATDWIFATLPFFLLRHANMKLHAKISVGFVLSLGVLGSICSCIRFIYLEGLLNTQDFFWSATNTAIWSVIEPGTGIIAGSLATYRPLFRKFYITARTAVSNASRSVSERKRRLSHSVGLSGNSSQSQKRTRSRSPFFSLLDKEEVGGDMSTSSGKKGKGVKIGGSKSSGTGSGSGSGSGSRTTNSYYDMPSVEAELIEYPKATAAPPSSPQAQAGRRSSAPVLAGLRFSRDLSRINASDIHGNNYRRSTAALLNGPWPLPSVNILRDEIEDDLKIRSESQMDRRSSMTLAEEERVMGLVQTRSGSAGGTTGGMDRRPSLSNSFGSMTRINLSRDGLRD